MVLRTSRLNAAIDEGQNLLFPLHGHRHRMIRKKNVRIVLVPLFLFLKQ